MTSKTKYLKVRDVNLIAFRSIANSDLIRAFDVANGIHSGIPICCVLSFAERRPHPHLRTRADEAYYRSHVVQYVQCQECFRLRRHVRVKSNGHVLRELIDDFELRASSSSSGSS